MLPVFIHNLFNLVQLLLFVRILLTWFPNIDWWKQPFKLLKDATDPILLPFRRLIPPIGGLDISPMAAFFALYVLEGLILAIL